MLAFDPAWANHAPVDMSSFEVPTVPTPPHQQQQQPQPQSLSLQSTYNGEGPEAAAARSYKYTQPMLAHKELRAVDGRENRRNFHRKVRTGCGTCKARHVKCDEVKPECNRCTSTGRQCEGYESSRKNRAAQRSNILPRDGRSTTNETSTTSSGSSADGSGSRSGSRSRSDRGMAPPVGPALGFFVTSDVKEKRYLDMFLNDTLPSVWQLELKRPEAWRKLMVQLIWDEDVVRHSAIALAAAHERQRLILQRQRSDPSKYAIEYYNKAIGHLLHDKPDTEAQATRASISLLSSCLLFTIMEMFLGRDGAVRTHLQAGVKILLQTKFASFASEELQLLSANFAALDTHARMYPGTGHSSYDTGLEPDAEALHCFSLSPRFASFHHAVTTYYQVCAQIKSYQTELQAVYGQPDSALLQFQARLLTYLQGWQAAYTDLKSSEGAQGTASSLNGQLMELGMAVQLLVIKGSHDPTQMIYDSFVDDARALVPRLARAITSRAPAATRFSADTLSNEMMCAWYLFRLCRDPGVRDALKGLLFKAMARRGAWCGMTTLLTLAKVRELEEQGLAPDTAGAPPSLGQGPPSLGQGPPSLGQGPPSLGQGPPSLGGPPPMGHGPASSIKSAAQIPSKNRLAHVALESFPHKDHCRVVYRRVGSKKEAETFVELWH